LGAVSVAAHAEGEGGGAKDEKIEVTGSSIKRINAQEALPVQTLKREDIVKSGATSTAELLAQISSNTAAFSQGLSISDGATQHGFSGASLRGLGAASTLVLLDGRRLANYAFNGAGVDLSAIPLAAIDRVEVLKDGASAIYGTDAIGGVINFILRKNYNGGEVSISHGNTEDGGGSDNRQTISYGYGDLNKDRFNVFGTLDYHKTQAITAISRDFAKTAYLPQFADDQTSSNTFPANIVMPDGSTINPSAPNCNPPSSIWNGSMCRYDYQTAAFVAPPTENLNFVGRGSFALTANTTLFAEVTASHNRAVYAISPSYALNPNSPEVYPQFEENPDGTFKLDSSGNKIPSPFYPNMTVNGAPLTGDLNLEFRLAPLGSRRTLNTSDADRFVVGAEGTIADWDYNVAYNHAVSRSTDHYAGGYVSTAGFNAAMNSGLINPFGAQTPAGMSMLQAIVLNIDARKATGTTDSVDGHMSREIFDLPAGAVSMAVGGEVRHEKLNDSVDPELASGDVLGASATSNTTGARSVAAAYTEFVIPVVRHLEAQVALREDHYSDFGNTFNPKVALRWQPSKEWLFRASYGTGFRAPTLPDLYASQTSGTTASIFNDQLRCPNGNPVVPATAYYDCGDQFPTQTQGNSHLQPEKSKQDAFGFFYEPSSGFSIGMDYWRINKTNVIEQLPDALFDTPAGFATYSQFIVRNPATPGSTVAPQIAYINLPKRNFGSLRTDGVDVELNARQNFHEYGRLQAKLSGTYVMDYLQQFDAGLPYLQNAGTFLPLTNQAIPRWRHVATVDWTAGAWDTSLTQNYQSSYTDENLDQNGNMRKVSSYETYDWQGNYSGFKGFRLTLGVKNLFDRSPPFSNQSSFYLAEYDPTYADPRGRFIYGTISWTFK
jgi:iron complex outermembrane receptor protein